MAGLFKKFKQVVCTAGEEDVRGGPLRFTGGHMDRGLRSLAEVFRFYLASVSDHYDDRMKL